jgi:transcriptional regulator with XRE-family HTH domain
MRMYRPHRPSGGGVAKNANYQRVTPDDIKVLRKELGCTARDLATTLGIEQKEVLAWEAGELFPTKHFVERMNALREKGPGAVLKTAKGKSVAPTDRVSDPAFWAIVKKLMLHPALYDQVSKLAEQFDEKKG